MLMQNPAQTMIIKNPAYAMITTVTLTKKVLRWNYLSMLVVLNVIAILQQLNQNYLATSHLFQISITLSVAKKLFMESSYPPRNTIYLLLKEQSHLSRNAIYLLFKKQSHLPQNIMHLFLPSFLLLIMAIISSSAVKL